MKLVLFILTVFCLIFVVYSECNVCETGLPIKCVTQTNFSLCPGDDYVYSCPEGTICSASVGCTNNTSIQSDCIGCSSCSSSTDFACTGVRSYDICLKGIVVSSGLCSNDTVCTQGPESLCSSAATSFPACSKPSVIAPTTATLFCQQKKENARFPGLSPNPFCKSYIYCFKVNAVWSGSTYTCPGITYFNPLSKYCEVMLHPKNCPS